jgi:glycosyltransferase involved in cell wall biosynthesis
LVIAGDTQYKDKYYSSLKEQASDNIIFTGFAVGELKKQLLSHATVFIKPSTMEGMPLSVLEAMSYGLPVIGSDIREISDIVVDRELLFKTGNIKSLIEILTNTLRNIEIHKNFANEAKGAVISKYSWDTTAKDLDDVLHKLI